MDQPQVYAQSGQEDADWLPPGLALAHFELPDSVRQAAIAPPWQDAGVRYGFRVGSVGLLIPLETGSEVLGMPNITPLPGSPPGFLGLLNLRGNLVPVYELRTLLHLEPRKGGDTAVLVLGQGDMAVGLVADGYPIALGQLKPVPNLPPVPDKLLDHVLGGYLQGNAVWMDFDHHAFFDEVSRGIRLATT